MWGPIILSKLLGLARGRRMLSLVDQAVISATNMGTSVLIGRTCVKAELGLYASGLSLILLLTAVQSALLSVPYTISSPGFGGEGKAVYKGSTVLQQWGLVMVGMGVFAGVGWWRGGGELGRVLGTLAVVSGVICFRDFARRVSYAELRFGFALVIDGLLAVAQIAVVGVLAWRHELSATRALLAVGVASTLAGGMWLGVNWKSMRFSLREVAAGARVNWGLGRWLFASSVLWSVCIDQYPWVIASLRGPGEAAVWASCYGVMAFLNPIVLALNNDAAPRVSHAFAAGGLEGLRKSVWRSAGIAGVMTLPVLLVLVVFGGRLVKLMYGGKFGGAGGVVAVLAGGLWLYALSLTFPYGMLALKRPGVDFAVNVGCLGSFLFVGVWMVRGMGVMGAAWSFALVQAVALGMRVVLFQRVVRQAERVAVMA